VELYVCTQSTRRCKWEKLDDQKEFENKIAQYRATASRLRLSASEMVNHYVNQRKREMKQLAWDRGLMCPHRAMVEKRAEETKKMMEEYYAMKEQEKLEQLLKNLADGLCASELI